MAMSALLFSCIDPIDVETGNAEPTLVVDGRVTNRPGPYEIKLSLSTGYGADVSSPPYTGAVVTVIDESGNEFPFTEIGGGRYLSDPNGFRGEVGKSYYLKKPTTLHKIH